MKKILFILMTATVLVSCEDFLLEEPKGKLAGNEILQNSAEGLDLALNGAYVHLTGQNWSSGFNTMAQQSVGMGAEDITTNTWDADNIAFDNLSRTNTQGRMDQIWRGCYGAIQSTTLVIGNYPSSKDAEINVDPIAGEAYFLRAFSYYWLVRLWGNIPLFETITDYQVDPKTITTSTPAEVYNVIISDLEMAISKLPNLKRDPGRPNKGSAKALLADVYLTMAGWPLKDNSHLSDAASLASELMTEKGAYGFDLVADFASLWVNGANSVGSPEEIFAFHFNADADWTTGSSLYGQSNDLNAGGWTDVFPELYFFNTFPAGARHDATFMTVIDGAPWQNHWNGHPGYKKFADASRGWVTSASHMMIRYAHVLLIYAEASARANNTVSAESYAAINAVRHRAGLADLSGLSVQEFINAVINERKWEFAGEGTTRWFDLTRLEKVSEANSNKDPNDHQIVGSTATDNYYLDIPYSETVLMPGLGK